MEVRFELSDLQPEEIDRLLGALIARYDEEFGREVEAMVRSWADQTEQAERDDSINPRGDHSPHDYRRLAEAIAEHREHLERLSGQV